MNGLLGGLPPAHLAFLGGQQMAQQQAQEQLKTGQGLMQLKSLLAKQQQEQAFRSEIAQAKTPEEQIAVASKYMGPDALARVQQGSLDRKATLEAANVNAAAQREQRLQELQIRGQQRADQIEQQAREGRISQAQAAADRAALQASMARLAASLRPEPQPRPVQTHTDGAGKLWEREPGGQWKPAAIGAGAPGMAPKVPIATLKEQQAREKMNRDLDMVIPSLEEISKDGGLIDQSTGSGAGALVDYGAAFVGKATPGSIAVGKLKPLVDPILKLVPRFEGPQSDKDTASYREAAGDLANPAVPNARKKAAAKEILEIYKRRRNEFTTTEYDAAAIDTGVSPYDGPDRRTPAPDMPPPGAVRRKN